MYKILTLSFFTLLDTALMASAESLASLDSHTTTATPPSPISLGRKGFSKSTYLEHIGLGKEEIELRQYETEQKKADDEFNNFIEKMIKGDKKNQHNENSEHLDVLIIKKIESKIKLKNKAGDILTKIQELKPTVHSMLRESESVMIKYLNKELSKENSVLEDSVLKTISRPKSPGSITRSLSTPEIETGVSIYINETTKQNMLKEYITYLGFPNFQKDIEKHEKTKDLQEAWELMTTLMHNIKENLEFLSPHDDYIRIMAFLRLSERIDDFNKSTMEIQFTKNNRVLIDFIHNFV